MRLSKLNAHFIVVLFLSVLCFYALHIRQFTVDSWTLFELSRTFFSDSDFYHVSVVRQYVDATEYSRAFPPLYPFLLWLVDSVCHTGIRSGILINIASCYGIYLLLETFFAKDLRSRRLIALTCFLSLLSAAPFLEEIQAGRTIPLSLVLWFTFARVLLPVQTLTLRRSILCGAILGLLTQLRFDALPAIPFAAVGLILAGSSLPILGAFLGSCLAFMSPWLIYSWTHFHVLWSSDAGAQSFYAFFYYNMDFIPDKATLPTLFTHPAQWLKVTGLQFIHASKSLLIFRYSAPMLVAVMLIAKKHRLTSIHKSIDKKTLIAWAPIVLPVLAHGLLILKSGFYQPRYFTLELSIAIILLGQILATNDSFKLEKIYAGLTAAMLIGSWTQYVILSAENGFRATSIIRGDQLNPEETAVAQFLSLAPANDRKILVAGNSIYYPRFGALTGLPVHAMPSNSNDCILVHLLDQYNIRYIYGSLDFPLEAFFETRTFPENPKIIELLHARSGRPLFTGSCTRLPELPRF